MNRHHHAVLALCSGLAITGCTTVNTTLTPISIDGAPAAATAWTAIQIANLDIQTKAIIGAENFEAAYDVVRAGSGKIAKYGLADPNGSVLLKPMFPIPVINNGHVRMGAIGPLPNITAAGPMDCTFWVVDDKGNESNHLSFTMTIQ